MNATKSRLMMYKFTKVVIAILIIPTLLFGIFCTVVMSNTRANGGLPSIFNYYVVQIPNNNFYNSQLNLYKADEYQMFVSLSGADYKVGDMVSYYAGEESPENQIIIENVEWIDNFAHRLPAKNLNNNFFHINPEIENFNHNLQFSGQGLVLNQNIIQNNPLNNATVGYEDSSADLAEVGLGKIEKIGIGRDVNNEAYIICSVLESPTDTIGKPILALNIIGLSTKSSPFFINLLLYSSTTISFIVMLLLPCALLITFQITNLSLVARQVRDEKIAKKRLIREMELKNQQEEFSGAKSLPSDSTKIFAGFLKGDVRLGSVGSLKNKAKVYNKEELEKIREGLLSNKKFKTTFDSEFDEDEYIDQLKNADRQKAQTKKNEETPKQDNAEISSNNNEIPENIVESYGLNVKDKERLSKNSIPPMQKSNEKPADSKTTSSTSTVSPTFKTSDIPPISSFGMRPSDTLQQRPDISRSSQNNEANLKEPKISSNLSSKTFQEENTRQKFEVPENSDFGNYFGFERKVEKPTQQKNISATSPEISETKLNKNENLTNKANSDLSEISDLGAKFGLKNKSDLNSDEEN